MVRESPKDPFTHGEDGQAENYLPEPTLPLCEKHAVDLIIDLVKENPGEITIIATAPMSNIAMAITKAPEIKPLIKEIVAISGAFGLNKYAFFNATGDTPQSEWNVYVDPEAAKIVYESGIPFVALGLDVATYFDVNFTVRFVRYYTIKEELLHRLYIICDFFHTVIKIYILKTFLYPCVQNIFL